MNVLKKSKNIFLVLFITISSAVLSHEYIDTEGRTTFYVPARATAPVYLKYHKEKNLNQSKKKVVHKKQQCPFCSKIKETADDKNLLLTRFEHIAVWLNLYPYTKGHILIIPKRHVENITDLTEEESTELVKIIAHSPEILKEVLGAQGTNIGQNTGKAAGTTLRHIHIHVVPRYSPEHVNHRIPSFIHTTADARFIGWDMNKLYQKLKPAFDTLKKELCGNDTIQNYYESGQYEQEIKQILKTAWAKLEKIPATNNTTIVIDIDETALSNYEFFKTNNWQKEPEKLFKAWRMLKRNVAIEPTREFYKKALAKGFKIIFMSCRGIEEYQQTYDNLIAQGYPAFEKIILRSSEEQKQLFSSSAFSSYKKRRRQQFVDEGYDIIACVGDQWSDIEGDNTGLKIKIPTYHS